MAKLGLQLTIIISSCNTVCDVSVLVDVLISGCELYDGGISGNILQNVLRVLQQWQNGSIVIYIQKLDINLMIMKEGGCKTQCTQLISIKHNVLV